MQIYSFLEFRFITIFTSNQQKKKKDHHDDDVVNDDDDDENDDDVADDDDENIEPPVLRHNPGEDPSLLLRFLTPAHRHHHCHH